MLSAVNLFNTILHLLSCMDRALGTCPVTSVTLFMTVAGHVFTEFIIIHDIDSI